MVGIFPGRDAIIRLVAPCWPSRTTNGPSPRPACQRVMTGADAPKDTHGQGGPPQGSVVTLAVN